MTTLEIKRQESKNIYLAIRKLQLEERLSLDAIAERLSLPKKRVRYLYKRHRRAELALIGLSKLKAEKKDSEDPQRVLEISALTHALSHVDFFSCRYSQYASIDAAQTNQLTNY